MTEKTIDLLRDSMPRPVVNVTLTAQQEVVIEYGWEWETEREEQARLWMEDEVRDDAQAYAYPDAYLDLANGAAWELGVNEEDNEWLADMAAAVIECRGEL